MNCARHPDRPATGYCRNCGRPLCSECARSVRGVLYCEDCLAALLVAPVAPPATGCSPGLAAVLGLVPGLGAVCNGEYIKAIVQLAIFAGLIALLNANPPESLQVFYGLGLAVFYLYMPIDAYRTARQKQWAAQAGPAATSPATAQSAPATAQSATPAGAIALLIVGTLLLLANLGMLNADWLVNYWPALLILLGLWLLWRQLHGYFARRGSS